MTDQHGAGGPVGRHDPSEGGVAEPGPLSPAEEEPARPSGPPATGGSAPSAQGIAAPAAASGPWASWSNRAGQGGPGSEPGQPQQSQPQQSQPQQAQQTQPQQNQPPPYQAGPGPSATPDRPPVTEPQPGGLQTAGTPAPGPGAGPGGTPGGSSGGGNPWGDYPGVEQGGPRRHPTEIFPAPSGVSAAPNRAVRANRADDPGASGTAPAGSAASAGYGGGAASDTSTSNQPTSNQPTSQGGPTAGSYGSAPSSYGSAASSYGSASSSYGTASDSYGSGSGSSATAPGSYGSAPSSYGTASDSYGSGSGSSATAAGSYGSAPSSYGTASDSYGSGSGSSTTAAGSYDGTSGSTSGSYGGGAHPAPSGTHQQSTASAYPATGTPGQGMPGQAVPLQPSGQPVNPGGPGKPGGTGRSSRRHFLATAGIAAATALVVGGGAGLAGSVIGRAGSGTETPPDGPTPAPTQEPGEAVGAAVAAKVLPSTVTILVSASAGNSSGSGFVLNADGLIMTNNHVVDSAVDSGRITVLFEDGTRATAEVVGRSPSYDIGVIKVDPGNLKLVPSELGDSDAVKVGDLAVALGAPLGLGGSVTQGIISARNRPVAVGASAEDASFMNALQTDAPINPGNSGGPLADGTGKIIGVNSAILSNASGDQRPGSIGIGFAIPINQAKVIGDQIIETGHATYPTAGVQVVDAGNRQGARIAQIQPGSPAAAGGLQEDDVVIKVDGRPVATLVEFIVALRSHRPGDEVTITYNRSGTPEETKVTLGEERG